MSRRKIILIVAVVLVVWVSFLVIFNNYQGSVTITASEPNAKIILYKNSGTELIGTGSARMTGPGTYTLHIENNESRSVIVVIVEPWKHKDRYVELIEPKNTEKVADQLAKSIIVSGDKVRFLQPETYEVLEFKQGEAVKPIEGFPRVRFLSWLDYNHAVFEDLLGNYFVFRNGQTSSLKINGLNLTTQSVSKVATGTGGEIAIIKDGSLYYSVNGQDFSLVTNDAQVDAALDVSKGRIAYAEKVEQGDDTYQGEGTLGENSSRIKVFDVDTGTQLVNTLVPLSPTGAQTLVQQIAFSPSTNRILLVAVDGVFVLNLSDAENFEALLLGSSAIPVVAIWDSEESIIFATNDGLWKSDITSQHAYLLSKLSFLPAGNTIRLDGNTLWYSDANIKVFGTGTINKINLD